MQADRAATGTALGPQIPPELALRLSAMAALVCPLADADGSDRGASKTAGSVTEHKSRSETAHQILSPT